MTPENKRIWVDALRSGKYQQTQDVLKNKNGFCCLGVLCEVLPPPPELENSPYKYAAILINEGRDNKYDVFQFIHKNDAMRWSFPEIADFVEEVI